MIKINARDCSIEKIDKKTEIKFLNENHIQKYAKSKVCYGLYIDNELVQLMSLGRPRFNTNYQWEIIRECTKKDHLVRGGTSKLWKHFLNNNKCRSCICYHYPHNKDLLFTSHLVDNCGFRCIKKSKPEKKIHFEGMWRGEYTRIDKSILERQGVDRLLKTNQGKDRTNEQILLDLGFEKKIEDGYSSQVDIYYPFGIVFRIDDVTDGTFYIGMTEVESKWNGGYLGSGYRWINHLEKHQDHECKRTILHTCNNPKETRDKELNEIKKYFIREGSKWVKINKKCMNTSVRSQNDEYILPIYDECGSRLGSHKKTCSKYKEPEACGECGSRGSHKKHCSKYKDPKPCEECGGVKSHKAWCSKYKTPKICDECGGIGSHKKSCSKYTKPKVCGECGVVYGNHFKSCSKYKEPNKCKECGGIRQHKKSCSKYKQQTICSECGSVSKHKKYCSKYVESKVCDECGHNPHLKTCSKYKTPTICDECGGARGQHKKSCSKFKSVDICNECGGRVNSHKKTCSKYKKPKPCEECGSVSHKKTCSKYKSPKPCPECGGRYGHKGHCSHYKKPEPCLECGAIIGHKSTCSKYNHNRPVCEECGHIPHIKSCSKYKHPDACPECGGIRSHKDGCSKQIVCPECGGKGGGHKKTCSSYRYKRCPECGSTSQHKSTCSKYKKPTVTPCSECGGVYSHKKTCSKFTQAKPCPECGVVRGHSKNCSLSKLCPECGGYPGHHKEDCSRAKRCDECDRVNGRHDKSCSHYSRCKECGVPRGGKHKLGCSKYKEPCPECGHYTHLKTCSKYKYERKAKRK